MRQKISVINRSSGKFTTETINNREHIITNMLSIEGDSVMNEIFYPNTVVTNALGQLNMLPAPAGHPEVDGESVSAFNPLAINANNFGGFIRNPKQFGKKVINELVIDTEVASKHEQGREIINRIKNGKRIGVSTGLIASLSPSKGTFNNQSFSSTVDQIEFDHVAVLLDNAPAGENTYTLNHGVVKNKITRGIIMDEVTFNLSDLSIDDRKRISNMSLTELLSHINHQVTVEEAQGIVTNAGLNIFKAKETDVNEFLANKEEFNVWKAKQLEKINETKNFIVENSKMSLEQLENMDSEQLEALSNSVVPKNNFSVKNGKVQKDEIELIDLDELQNSLKEAG